ncbi:MAG: hypothetical protein KatS3mg076_1512 [Candidatus Binatia bacterium]|nr:MAG: hypothetical protein KatS3mg076_1512 [Candidatus Binatia bacterium]
MNGGNSKDVPLGRTRAASARSRSIRAALLSAALLSSCAFLAPRPDPSRFYVLAPVPPPEKPVPAFEAVLGLGPVDFPDYLERPNFVVRLSSTRLDFSERSRWAEPLDANFQRTLAENLSRLLRPKKIESFPWFGNPRLDYQVEIEVLEFEVDAEGTARLAARWALRDGKTKKLLDSGEARFEEPSEGKTTAARVAALSRALGKFSDELARALRRVASGGRPA